MLKTNIGAECFCRAEISYCKKLFSNSFSQTVYEDVNNAELQQKKNPTEKQPPPLTGSMTYYKLGTRPFYFVVFLSLF